MAAVWDRTVRIAHWVLAPTVLAAWWTGSSTSLAHEVLGYVVGAIVAARIAWGFLGGRYARFGQFVRGPAATLGYLRAALAGTAPRYVGHNPLGGWMVVALLASIVAVTITGILYTTDWLWGYGWLANLHAALGWIILGLAALHVGGVLVTGWKHHENLVLSMLNGRKRDAAAGDVE